MRLYIALLLLLAISFRAHGQTDSEAPRLINEIRQAGNDSAKIATYRKLIQYYSVTKPDTANFYADEAIAYARKKNYPVGEANIIAQLGSIDQNQGRISSAEQRINTALKIYRQQKYLKGVAEMLHDLGSIEGAKGNFNNAIKYYVRALKEYDSVIDYHGEMMVYMNLGGVYLEHQDTASAHKYLNTAAEISKKIPIDNDVIFLYNLIGVLYAETGKPDSAFIIFRNNLELSDKPQFVRSHMECLTYLGEFCLEANKPEEGLRYFKTALKLSRDYKIPEMEANILMDIATAYKGSNPKLALEYLQQAKTICEHIGGQQFLLAVIREMSSVYEQLGDYKEALSIYRYGQKIADSVFSMNRAKEIATITSAYEYEANQEIKALNTLNKHNAKQRDEIIVAAICLAILLMILYINYRRTIQLNKKLTEHEKQLEELNSMKDKLFSVIGHDLRGPIARIPAIIDIYEAENTTPDEKKFLLDNLKEHTKASLETFDKLLYWGQSLIKGISLHQVRMQTKGYINEAIELRKMKAAEKRIKIIDHTPADIFVFADPSLFDFIIRNLLANALKYTYPDGSIEINADTSSRPGFTIFSVKDSGMGMDERTLSRLFYSLESRFGTDNEKGHGIGLMLCKEFAVQNGGDIWAESTEGKGSTFFFSVKSVA